ncbi:MAG: hypothetical protein CMJ35_01600 [Phycisphaerae bacterium]|nr:hypothetical protein [Phycisphaerae bacterium]
MAPSLTHDRSRWIKHLEALTRPVLKGVPFEAPPAVRAEYIETFRDEFGNRRASDRPFLCHMLGVTVPMERDSEAMGLDERLWWCVARCEPLPAGLIAPIDGLLPDPDSLAIEYRTMVELGALHAFWALSMRDGGMSLRQRALDAARWHIQELQPDNAINRPWGLPVFLQLSFCDTDESVAQTAQLHAQTLLHNACINFGKPDLLSAMILHNAAQMLEASAQ